MSLADGVTVMWVAALLLVGLIGFFAVALLLVWRFFGFVLRALFGWGSDERHCEAVRPDGRRRVCPHPRCGHLNPPNGRYCGRCGRPLVTAYDVDAYG